MDCREYRTNIRAFIKDELDAKKTIRLIRHIDTCAECKEELKIQFLVFEGLKRLENGGTFDLNKDFATKIRNSLKYSKAMESFHRVIQVAKAAGIVVAICYLLIGLLF